MVSTIIVDQAGGGDFTSIQAAVDAASVDAIIVIKSGTYDESVSITKALNFVGDSTDGPVIVTSTSGSAFVISGDLGDDGTLSFDGIEFRDALGSGIEFGSGDTLGTLQVSNCTFEGNDHNGVAVFDGSGLANAIITDSIFTGNGQPHSSSGDGDILLYQYNGDALLKNLTITGQDSGTGAGENGIQLRADSGAMGEVVIENVTISGIYEKQPIAIFNYDNVDGLRMRDVTITADSQVYQTAINFDGIGDDINFASKKQFKNVDVSGAGLDDIVALQGDDGDNLLRGGKENNFLRGGDGDDVLSGGGGNDYLLGGDGDDVLFGDNPARGHGSGGHGRGHGSGKGQGSGKGPGSGKGSGKGSGGDGAFDDYLSGGVGDDELYGGKGTDTAAFFGIRTGFEIEVEANASGLVTRFDSVRDILGIDGNEGFDQLRSIESLEFADAKLDLNDLVQLFDTSGALVGTFDNLKAAVLAAGADYKIVIGDGVVNLADGGDANPAQIVIDKNLTIQGQGQGDSVIQAIADTGSSGNSRGMFLVNSGVTLDISDLTVSGAGQQTYQAFRHMGSGNFDNVEFTEIKFGIYSGVAIAAFGGGPGQNIDVTNSDFSEIGRIGVLYFGADVSGTFEGNSYNGKGVGDFLDYALDISAGADITVRDNQISDNLGVAASDGSTSAAILVTTYFGGGTTATIGDNSLTDNTHAVAIGYNGNDSSNVVFVGGNHINGGGDGIHVVGNGTVSGIEFLKGPGADVVWEGGAAANTITGGRRDDDLKGGGGADVIDGGKGDDSLAGQAGDDILTGGKGQDLFVFADGGGDDSVTDFKNGKDLLDVSDYGLADSLGFDGISAVGGDVVIDINGSDSITLIGVNLANIDDGDFLF
ncbi:MAG: hypothetical protein HOA08_10925 [Rhodospirillaceae bacterium]|nr:hypothetical protein [Rhodospirillaceae bacterium]MBT3491681.1 hypothetical protein [Rhodospirillaceae bacterium]MBT3783263.1 hypothetical protein [Rhodospirillaceae bacterium]MBT3978259.1 hypothetical protein [Rhodospirillaceae bacterium]MBT4168928.1 hypothetical protein [Rhodospirillaceae bacterium]